MSSNPTVLLLGTCDTKLDELLYTKEQLESHATTVLLMDIGRITATHPQIDITHNDILKTPPQNANTTHADDHSALDLSALARADYIAALAPYATNTVATLHQQARIHAVLGIGGSCGTAVATALMRDALPVGFPKLMVSTMASGDVGPYIGETDIALMYSVVDIAGRNRVLERVLENAAGAAAGMAQVYRRRCLSSAGSGREAGQDQAKSGAPRIGITMFGVTTPAATHARQHLESVIPGCEVYVFHATGSGGRAMERLVAEGQLDAVLDLTTTEIADEVVGGVLSAGPARLTAATRRNIPRVVSVGACDMVNFGTPESVPARFLGEGEQKRRLHPHNPTVTVMRTTREECAQIARLIARNIRMEDGSTCRTRVILPTGGVSMLDVPGQSFWDPEADEMLFSTLADELQDSGISVTRDAHDINDPGFAVAAAEMLRQVMDGGWG
ncbi:uncharacterized protein N7459_003501 [Penicillium hispanicum]|uniref:uncharacterized protein n=1 Tax=Penicillium hispanicum TaxID=1080232 RepID=UPI0025409CCC|nr:uncharacterized protein N7459_003501 [Penicillium hispanicum]KAJ5587736.1 hypothetical protein N7459_003501 [Penicillium hispanicum]